MSDKKITLVFVVGGDNISVDANENEPLQAARNKALGKSKDDSGRAPDEWDVKDLSGQILDDVKKSVGEYGFTDGTKLVLTPKVSGGGSL